MNSADSFDRSRTWFVTLGDDPDFSVNPVKGQYVNFDYDAWGKEMVI